MPWLVDAKEYSNPRTPTRFTAEVSVVGHEQEVHGQFEDSILRAVSTMPGLARIICNCTVVSEGGSAAESIYMWKAERIVTWWTVSLVRHSKRPRHTLCIEKRLPDLRTRQSTTPTSIANALTRWVNFMHADMVGSA